MTDKDKIKLAVKALDEILADALFGMEASEVQKIRLQVELTNADE